MIRFNVDHEADKTGEVKKHYIRNCVLRSVFLGLICSIIFESPLVVILIKVLISEGLPIEIALIVIPLAFILILSLFYLEIYLKNKSKDPLLWVAILTEETEIELTFRDGYLFNPIKTIKVSKIKRIEDWGNFYSIVCHFPREGHYILQKQLIVEGTIEEFETFFEDFIVRKTVKK